MAKHLTMDNFTPEQLEALSYMNIADALLLLNEMGIQFADDQRDAS